MLKGLAKYISSVSPWEAAVIALNPAVWLKCTESTSTALIADGNFGYDGGTVSVFANGLVFGQAGIMPSDLSRKTVYQPGAAGSVGDIEISGLVGGVNTNTLCVYCVYKGNSTTVGGGGFWRDLTNATWADLNVNNAGTLIQIFINGNLRDTTYPASSILDNNAHLIGVSYTATSTSLWVDGVSVWTGLFGGGNHVIKYFTYLSWAPTNGCAKGYYGDFIVFNSSLTPTDHAALYAAWS